MQKSRLFKQNSAQGTGGVFEIVTPRSDSTLTNVTALNNSAGASGGVLHQNFSSPVNVVGGLFGRNTAVVGGAFSVVESTLTIDGATISGNEATGADATQGGGGIYVADRTEDTFASLEVTNTRIVGNTASGAAGSGGGVFIGTEGDVTITGSRIAENKANRAGGGIENAGGEVYLESVTLGGTDSSQANDAGSNPGNGGGLHTSGADAFSELYLSSVGYNTAVEGGGLWSDADSDSFFIETSTVSNNTATRGAGIYLNGDGSGVSLDFASITNNDGTGIEFGTSGSGSVLVLTPSLAANNTGGDVGSNVDVTYDGDLDSSALVTGTVPVGAYRLFGGTTATQPLTPASTAALDTNDSCGDEFSATDQRGASRPFPAGTGNCDVGAFELTDDPVIPLTNNSLQSVAINNASDEVSVAAFTLSNSSDSATTISGVSGYINRGGGGDGPSLPAGLNIANGQLTIFEDDNQNGLADSGENEVGAGQVEANGATFSVTFNPSASIPANDSMSYVVTFRLAAPPTVGLSNAIVPIFAGGGLLGLIGLMSLGSLGRRTRIILLVVSLAVMLAACNDDNGHVNVGGSAGGGAGIGDNGVGNVGGGGGNGGDDGDAGGNGDDNNGTPTPLAANQIQFVIDLLTPSNTDDLIIGDNLPISGSTVTIDLDDSAPNR